jgi:hypothetical protein
MKALNFQVMRNVNLNNLFSPLITSVHFQTDVFNKPIPREDLFRNELKLSTNLRPCFRRKG